MLLIALACVLAAVGLGVAALVRGARILHESEQDDDR
jgi:hypothetical protein